MQERTRKVLWVIAITAAVAAAMGTVATLLVRDQISRRRRNLFSPLSLKRIVALEHLARQVPSVDHILLLRDYIAWEPRRLLRNRARAIVERMEGAAADRGGPVEEPAA